MSGLASAKINFRELSQDEIQAKRAMLPQLEELRQRLLTRQPFIATLAMRMDLVPVIDARLPTAATDGQHLFFSVPFMESLDLDDRLFIMAHEVWHCAALHILRRGNREPERWNIAIDHETNHILREQGMRLPQGGIHFPHFADENAETVYERLPEQLPDRGTMADEHEIDLELMEGDPSSIDMPIDPDFAPRQSKKVWQEWPRRVHAAAQQAYRFAGDRPGWLDRLLALHGKPSMPWQDILRRFVDRTRSEQFRWTPPSRRFAGQGLILPGRSGERLRIAVAVDTSGSTHCFMPQFLAELQGILRSFGRFELRLIGCDTRVCFDQTFDDANPLPQSLTLGGGGGTVLDPVFERLASDKPPVLVFLTDGYVNLKTPAPPYPVLWCLTPDGQRPVAWGETLQLPERKAGHGD